MRTKELSRYLELISAKDLIKSIKISFDVDGIYVSGMSDSNTSTIVIGKYNELYRPLIGKTIYAPSANEMYKRIKMVNADDIVMSIEKVEEVDKLTVLGGIVTQKIPLIKASVAGTFPQPIDIVYDVVDMELSSENMDHLIKLFRSISKADSVKISVLNGGIHFDVMEGRSSSANYTVSIPHDVAYENLPGGIIFNKIDLLKILLAVGTKINVRIGIYSDGMLYLCAVDANNAFKVEYYLVN